MGYVTRSKYVLRVLYLWFLSMFNQNFNFFKMRVKFLHFICNLFWKTLIFKTNVVSLDTIYKIDAPSGHFPIQAVYNFPLIELINSTCMVGTYLKKSYHYILACMRCILNTNCYYVPWLFTVKLTKSTRN